MKKVLVGLSTIAVIGIGGILVAGQVNEDEPKQEVVASSETKKAEPIKEVVEIPQERTTNIGENYPWQYYTTEKAASLINNGETLFLYSDASAVENYVIETLNYNPPEEGTDKQFFINTAAEFIELYTNEVSQHVENQDYFDKMQEVEQSLLSGQYDQIPKLIEEAKTLRES